MSNLKSLIKRLIPEPSIAKLMQLYRKFDLFLIRMFAVTGFTASIYYCFVNRQFYREHRATLLGRIRYHQMNQIDHLSNALLRRNVHRLEKGLIMRPRKNVFAEDYIFETVDAYLEETEANQVDSEELGWCRDVLVEFFSVVEHTQPIQRAHSRFQQSSLVNTSPDEYGKGSNSQRIPYPQSDLPASTISYEALDILFQRRRSVRWFTSEPLLATEVRQAIESASLAPSACNRQPYAFRLFLNTERAARVAQCAMGTAGFYQNIHSLIVVVGQLNYYPEERDRHCIYIDGSLAAMQLMLALETFGIASCPINWPDIESRERAMAKLLNLEFHQRPLMLIAMGYPDPKGGIPYSQKKPYRVLAEVEQGDS